MSASASHRMVVSEASTGSRRAFKNIGSVLENLKSDFPQVSASKIRFLEEKGLISPQRTAAGYRKYDDLDVERLRFILALQRDQYLPLKVIKDYLTAVDAGERPESLPGGMKLTPRSVSGRLAHELVGNQRPMSRSELQDASGADSDLLDALEQYNLISTEDDAGYSEQSLTVARSAVHLLRYGIEPRHLRPFRVAADREIGLVQQALSSVGGQNDPSAHGQVSEAAREIGQACLKLHGALVSESIENMGH